jgi:hypothetical protein
MHGGNWKVYSQFWGVFPSDRNPKATKDVHVHLFIDSSNSCKLYQRVRKLFEAPTYRLYSYKTQDTSWRTERP